MSVGPDGWSGDGFARSAVRRDLRSFPRGGGEVTSGDCVEVYDRGKYVYAPSSERYREVGIQYVRGVNREMRVQGDSFVKDLDDDEDLVGDEDYSYAPNYPSRRRKRNFTKEMYTYRRETNGSPLYYSGASSAHVPQKQLRGRQHGRMALDRRATTTTAAGSASQSMFQANISPPIIHGKRGRGYMNEEDSRYNSRSNRSNDSSKHGFV